MEISRRNLFSRIGGAVAAVPVVALVAAEPAPVRAAPYVQSQWYSLDGMTGYSCSTIIGEDLELTYKFGGR